MGQRRLTRPTVFEWLLLAAGLALVPRYLWYMDDCFVYFRYVENFVGLGRGLVYNQGEFVEGFTSPLWLLTLCGLRATGLGFPAIVTGVALLAYATFWLSLVRLNRRMSPEGAPVMNLPLAALALNYGVLCYFSSGLESPLVLLAALGFAWAILEPRAALPQVVVALAPLVRPELLLAVVVAWGWCWIATRRFPWRMTAVLLLSLGGWALFRIWYYAELLPTPFYLKDSAWWSQGLLYLRDTTSTYGFPFLMGGGLLLLILVHRRGGETRLAPRLVMLGIAALSATYVVRIGGDARHFRYLAFPYVLAVLSLAGLPESLAGAAAPSHRRRLVLGAGVAVALVTLCCFPRQIRKHPALVPLAVSVPWHGIHDATYHRSWDLITQVVAAGPETLAEAGLAEQAGPFHYRDVVMGPFCVLHYRYIHDRAVHTLGLTEPVLARMTVAADRPGHKYDLVQRAPQLEAVRRDAVPLAPGTFRAAAESGDAPPWVAANLEALELLERKVANRHDLLENVGLALRFVGGIEVGEEGSP